MKLMISQPMRGKNNLEGVIIWQEREDRKNIIKQKRCKIE